VVSFFQYGVSCVRSLLFSLLYSFVRGSVFFSLSESGLLKGKRVIWIHAVSVGEVLAIEKFLDFFKRQGRENHVLLTTVTPTGQKMAKRFEGGNVTVCYFPFDINLVIRRFLREWKPQCLLLTETELWPNLLIEMHRAGIPVGILNARLSEKSVAGYRRLGFIFSNLFEKLEFVLAQTEQDAERFASLGVSENRIHVLGNMKFDNVTFQTREQRSVLSLKEEWGLDSGDSVIIAGSTHPGEEAIVTKVFCQLRTLFPTLKLIVAPRHIERSRGIARALRSRYGVKVRLATEGSRQESFEVLILNQLGILRHLYAVADVVFMGGSLVHRGGQNPIEAAAFMRPILHGPDVFNFDRVYQILDRERGAKLVRDESELASSMSHLLQNEEERKALGNRAYEVIHKLQGATQRHLRFVLGFLKPESQERVDDVQLHSKLFSSTGTGL